MKTSTDRILTTHVGSLPRSKAVTDGVFAEERGTLTDEPALQRKVLRLAVAAARADRHLADGEALVLAAARRHWGLGEEPEAGSPFAGAPQGA